MLGRGDHVGLRRVRHDDATPGRGLDVHVVDTDTSTCHRAQPVGLRQQVGVDLGGRADHDAVELGDALLEFGPAPAGADLDVEAGRTQQVDARRADLLGDQHSHHCDATTQSMQAVSASTSAGSTAGNIPTRNWLRPSLRYGSTSTIPFARSVFAIAAASTSSVKSIVPTTRDRFAGSVTNGVANSDFSAHSYSRVDDAVVRATQKSSPPPAEHPFELVGEQQQRGEGGRVVRLVLPRVLERGGQRQ